jgi:hypothetical protein
VNLSQCARVVTLTDGRGWVVHLFWNVHARSTQKPQALIAMELNSRFCHIASSSQKHRRVGRKAAFGLGPLLLLPTCLVAASPRYAIHTSQHLHFLLDSGKLWVYLHVCFIDHHVNSAPETAP